MQMYCTIEWLQFSNLIVRIAKITSSRFSSVTSPTGTPGAYMSVAQCWWMCSNNFILHRVAERFQFEVQSTLPTVYHHVLSMLRSIYNSDVIVTMTTHIGRGRIIKAFRRLIRACIPIYENNHRKCPQRVHTKASNHIVNTAWCRMTGNVEFAFAWTEQYMNQ